MDLKKKIYKKKDYHFPNNNLFSSLYRCLRFMWGAVLLSFIVVVAVAVAIIAVNCVCGRVSK